jgi:hypothetical protein
VQLQLHVFKKTDDWAYASAQGLPKGIRRKTHTQHSGSSMRCYRCEGAHKLTKCDPIRKIAEVAERGNTCRLCTERNTGSQRGLDLGARESPEAERRG